MNRFFVSGMWMLGFAFGGAARGEETVESIEKQVVERWAKVQSLSASTLLDSTRKLPDRIVTKTTTGTYLFYRDGGRELVRQEVETHEDVAMTFGKEKPMGVIPTAEKKTMVTDGTEIRMLVDGPRGLKAARMLQHGSGIVIGGAPLFQFMRKGAELQAAPDSKLGGRDVWVVQAKQNVGANKTSFLIDKEWGVLLQRVTFLARDGEEVPATTYSVKEPKVNTDEVTKERFDFEFPPGMEVTDQTQGTP